MWKIELGVIVERLRPIADDPGATVRRPAIGRVPSRGDDVVAVDRARRQVPLAELLGATRRDLSAADLERANTAVPAGAPAAHATPSF